MTVFSASMILCLQSCTSKTTTVDFAAIRAKAAQAAAKGDTVHAADLFRDELFAAESLGPNDCRLATALNDMSEYNMSAGHTEKCLSSFQRAMDLCEERLPIAKEPNLKLVTQDDRNWATEAVRSCFGAMKINGGLGLFGNAKDQYKDAKQYCLLVGDNTRLAELEKYHDNFQKADNQTNETFDDAVLGKTGAAFNKPDVRKTFDGRREKLTLESTKHHVPESEWLRLLNDAKDEFSGTKDDTYRSVLKEITTAYERAGMYDKAQKMLEDDLKNYAALESVDPRSEEANPMDAFESKDLSHDLEDLAAIHMKKHEYSKAVTVLQRALGLSRRYRTLNNLAELHELLGVAYQDMGGDQSQSIQEFTTAVALLRHNSDKRLEYMNALADAQKKAKAGYPIGKAGPNQSQSVLTKAKTTGN